PERTRAAVEREALALLQAPTLSLYVLDVLHLPQGGPHHARELLALRLVAGRQHLLGQVAGRDRLGALLQDVGQQAAQGGLALAQAKSGWGLGRSSFAGRCLRRRCLPGRRHRAVGVLAHEDTRLALGAAEDAPLDQLRQAVLDEVDDVGALGLELAAGQL